jgi:Glycosyltransferase family 9 (heptosyltransferase)
VKKVFYIDGGAGRAIAAIPALLKYDRLNPQDDWCVLVPGWDPLYWGIPQLQGRTYSPDTKGVFDNIIQQCDVIEAPEPYRNPGYFRQEISLVQAFDREINKTLDHSDLGLPQIVLNKAEEKFGENTVADVKEAQKKTRTVVIQPFGRGARVDRGDVIDDGTRSLTINSFLSLSKKLALRYNLIFFGDPAFQIASDNFTAKMKPETDIRMWSAIINAADYLVGVDSVGQHMARALGKPGTVIFGSTFPINVSYPDWFQIIEKPGTKKYSPIRIAGLDGILADRINDKLMDWSERDINDMYNKIVADIERKVGK